jgi:hypothetical protein
MATNKRASTSLVQTSKLPMNTPTQKLLKAWNTMYGIKPLREILINSTAEDALNDHRDWISSTCRFGHRGVDELTDNEVLDELEATIDIFIDDPESLEWYENELIREAKAFKESERLAEKDRLYTDNGNTSPSLDLRPTD